MNHAVLSLLKEGKHAMRVHLIGVAGSGMSGLASLLLELGHTVTGSDKVSTLETQRLQKHGLIFHCPQNADRCAAPVGVRSAIAAGDCDRRRSS